MRRKNAYQKQPQELYSFNLNENKILKNALFPRKTCSSTTFHRCLSHVVYLHSACVYISCIFQWKKKHPYLFIAPLDQIQKNSMQLQKIEKHYTASRTTGPEQTKYGQFNCVWCNNKNLIGFHFISSFFFVGVCYCCCFIIRLMRRVYVNRIKYGKWCRMETNNNETETSNGISSAAASHKSHHGFIDNILITDQSSRVHQIGNDLRIDSASRKDAGYYNCIATKIDGLNRHRRISSTVKLEIVCK